MLWGFPPFKQGAGYGTNFRSLKNHLWRGWLDREHRCVVPATAFAEPDQNTPKGAVEWRWFERAEAIAGVEARHDSFRLRMSSAAELRQRVPKKMEEAIQVRRRAPSLSLKVRRDALLQQAARLEAEAEALPAPAAELQRKAHRSGPESH
jgi:hypothetical protein